MTEANVGAPQRAPVQGEQQRPQINWRGVLWQMFIFYMIFNFFTGSKSPPTDPVTGKKLPPFRPYFSTGTTMHLKVYTSYEQEVYDNTELHLLWEESYLTFDWNENNLREKNFTLPVSKELLNNQTLWAHIFLYRSRPNYKLNPLTDIDSLDGVYQVSPLTVFRPKKQEKFVKNLITGETEGEEEQKKPEETLVSKTEPLISHWKPSLTLSLVYDVSSYQRNSIPQQISQHLTFRDGYYLPILFINDFWIFNEKYLEINSTVETLPLEARIEILSMMKFQFTIQMEESLNMQRSMGTTDSEADDFKRLLVETNPYLLGLTVVVTLLHMIFDTLAFKNDIQFWKDNKSLEGLSVRTIFLNCFCQIVIFLYLLDNDTSWVVLLSAGVGLLIEFWKVTKASDVSVHYWGKIPYFKFADKETYKSKTKEFDELAMKYLSYILYPLILGYSIYSLYYQKHKSWYSWVLNSLVGTVYTFGFIMMTPQLWINYKLKSVAHLPWKVFMYKALNTFIDDLFAFIITMPTMHRLSCFRDDLIFFIYLYQRWIYPVDKTRVNEYGQHFDDSNETEKKSDSKDSSGESTDVSKSAQTETNQTNESKKTK